MAEASGLPTWKVKLTYWFFLRLHPLLILPPEQVPFRVRVLIEDRAGLSFFWIGLPLLSRGVVGKRSDGYGSGSALVQRTAGSLLGWIDQCMEVPEGQIDDLLQSFVRFDD